MPGIPLFTASASLRGLQNGSTGSVSVRSGGADILPAANFPAGFNQNAFRNCLSQRAHPANQAGFDAWFNGVVVAMGDYAGTARNFWNVQAPQCPYADYGQTLTVGDVDYCWLGADPNAEV